jgi:hypothetical protein
VKKKEMKTTIRLIGVVAIAMVLSIAFSGLASASQPVCPTPETETVRSVTMITCQGMVTETEDLTWESSNEDLINNPPLGVEEVVGKLTYYEDLKVTDGITNFIKNIDVDTGDTPNLNVMKSIGYVQRIPELYESIGSLSHTEQVGFGVVADWAPTADVILCPFAAAAEDNIPASCEDVKASSKMIVTDVLATTVTSVGISESPLNLLYEVDATGSGGAGTAAAGHIVGVFEVYVEDGSSDMDDHCGMGDVAGYTLGSKMSYYERSSANGLWEFHKEMEYQSKIRP